MNLKKLRSLADLDCMISGLAFVVLVCITFVGVIMRYVFNNSLTWLEEAQLGLVVWCVYFSVSAALRNRSHVAIELFVDALPAGLQRVIEFLGQIVLILVLSYTFIQGIAFVNQMNATGRTTSILKIPYAAIYIALPISCVLTIANQLVIMVNEIRERHGKKDTGKEEKEND